MIKDHSLMIPLLFFFVQPTSPTFDVDITMDSIIALNNTAAILIDNGDYRRSLAILKSALVLLLDNVDSDDAGAAITRITTSTTTGVECFRRKKPVLREQSRITKPGGVKRASNLIDENDESVDNEDFVYRAPIHLDPREAESCEDADTEIECELNIILLFNLALGNHLCALEEGGKQPNEGMLKKALQYYELSFSMQLDIESMTMTQTLALVNNCASIYRLLGRMQSAERFYQHILSTLMTMIENGETSEVEQLDGFLRNVCRLVLQDVAAPAA
jgi:tetratricopeptide (TPR) repeat protein